MLLFTFNHSPRIFEREQTRHWQSCDLKMEGVGE